MVLLGTSIVWAFRIKIEERKHIPNLPNNCGSFCLYFHSCAFMAVTMPFSLSPRRKTACCFLVLNWAVWDDYWMQHVTRSVQCVQNAFEPLWWTSDDLIIQLLNPGRVFAIINPSITTPLNTCCHIIYHVIQLFGLFDQLCWNSNMSFHLPRFPTRTIGVIQTKLRLCLGVDGKSAQRLSDTKTSACG